MVKSLIPGSEMESSVSQNQESQIPKDTNLDEMVTSLPPEMSQDERSIYLPTLASVCAYILWEWLIFAVTIFGYLNSLSTDSISMLNFAIACAHIRIIFLTILFYNLRQLKTRMNLSKNSQRSSVRSTKMNG